MVPDRRGSVVRRLRRHPYRSAVGCLVLATQAKRLWRHHVKATRVRAPAQAGHRLRHRCALPPRLHTRARQRLGVDLQDRGNVALSGHQPIVSSRGELLRAGHEPSVSCRLLSGHRGPGESARTGAGRLRRHQRTRERRAGGIGSLRPHDRNHTHSRSDLCIVFTTGSRLHGQLRRYVEPPRVAIRNRRGRGYGALDRNGVRSEHSRCPSHHFGDRCAVRTRTAGQLWVLLL